MSKDETTDASWSMFWLLLIIVASAYTCAVPRDRIMLSQDRLIKRQEKIIEQQNKLIMSMPDKCWAAQNNRKEMKR